MDDTPVLRPASAQDSRFIAEMLDLSSDGVALIEWTETAQHADGLSPVDIGAQMYASGEGDYSYRNCWVADVQGRRAGMLLGFPMPGKAASESVTAPPFDGSDVFAPYKYLEAPNTWYICGVAVHPDFRRKGIGKRLMRLARERAQAQGYSELSLVVFEENTPAMQLYNGLGYKTIDRAPIVPHPLIRCSGDALLMVAPVKQAG